MRHRDWWTPCIALALVACGDDRLELEHDGINARIEALAAPFDPLICTLGEECERWGDSIVTPAAEAFACAPLSGALQPPLWDVALAGVPCPFGLCAALEVQLVHESAGSLLAMLSVQQPEPMFRMPEAGLWLARYAGDGALLGARLWDFAIPPPGIEVRRHARLLDAGDGARLATARTVLPGDAPQPLAWVAIGGTSEPKPRGARVTTPVLHPGQAAAGPNGVTLLGSLHEDAEGSARSVMTLLDRHGRVLWNRPWSAGAYLQALHVDGAGRVAALLWGDGVQVLARLDSEGRVLWQRVVASADAELRSQIDDAGNVYVLATLWDEAYAVTLERIDALGESTAAWSLEQLGSMHELHRGRQGVWLTARNGFDLGVDLELDLLPFGPELAAGEGCTGSRSAWSGTWDDFVLAPLALAESAAGEVYAAHPRMIFKLVGGAP
jgi:hypothetical protein